MLDSAITDAAKVATDTEITLIGSTPAIRVPDAKVFFTFGSGRLDYDCHACGAQCCRGHGFGATGQQELDALMALQPVLKVFASSRGAPSPGGTSATVFRSCPPACFFLDGDGLCGVQRERGYDLKPETCRLFPFNAIRYCDGHLIVGPHTKLCPLKVLPIGTSSDRSNHARLIENMALRGVSYSMVQQVKPVGARCAEVVALERRVVSLTNQDGLLSYRAYLEAQVCATLELRQQSGVALKEVELLESLERTTTCINRLFGTTGGAPESAWLPVLLAVTPTVRSYLAFRKAGEEDSALPLVKIPNVLSGLAVLVSAAHQAGMQNVTYQTVLHLFYEFSGTLQLCGWLDDVMVLKPDVTIDLAKEASSANGRRVVALYRALTRGQQMRRRGTLGALLIEYVGDANLDRMGILEALARRLLSDIVPISTPTNVRWHRNPGARLQQWALSGIGTDALLSIGSRGQWRNNSSSVRRGLLE